MKRAAIKVLYRQVTWLGLEVHAFWRQVSARAELLRISYIYPDRVTGKFRLGTGEFKAAYLANNTTGPIATHQPFTLKRLFTGLNSYAVCSLMKAGNSKTASDLHTQSCCAAGQHRFKFLHFRD